MSQLTEASQRAEALQARVAELQRQLLDREIEEGNFEDDRPHLDTPESRLFYEAFWKLIAFSGFGGSHLDWGNLMDWASRHGVAWDLADEVMYDLRSAYHEIYDELNPPKT